MHVKLQHFGYFHLINVKVHNL